MTGLDVEAVLRDHLEGALTCYDHPPTQEHPAWCCVCGAHDLMISWTAHVAAVLRVEIAEWLRGDDALYAAAYRESDDLMGVLSALANQLDPYRPTLAATDPIIHAPGCGWETGPYCTCGADPERTLAATEGDVR